MTTDDPRTRAGIDRDAATLHGAPATASETSAETVADGGPGAAAASSRRERRVGSYRLVRPLGEGAMGRVWLAEQPTLGRRVALKVLRPGVAGPALLRRFELESRLLARLHHPGIAQVHEAGTIDLGDGPQPYFAMELVEGRALDEHARDERLDDRARLALVAEICDAIQHAHQKGVVHRDLKPANILVDRAGRPRVLDFGVARLLESDAPERTLRTEAGQVLGTLAYMSPEQVAGDPDEVDTRTDVFALGAILYELLAGVRPHDVDRRTLAEAVRIVAEAEAPPIGAHRPELRGDVETILAKALAPDRESRYASASDLAADLRRHLADEPILARAPSTLYVLRKFARRHRAMVGAATLATVALVAATALSTAGFATASAARARAVAAGDLAAHEAARATAINRFLVEDLFGVAHPDEQAGADVTVRSALDRAASSIDNAFAEQSDLQLELHDLFGRIYAAVGAFDDAERHLVEARAIADADPAHALDALHLRRSLAIVERDRGRPEPAEATLRAVLAEAERTLGAEDVETAQVRADLGSVMLVAGRPEEAEALLLAAIPVIERELGAEHRQALIARHNLATVRARLGRLDETAAELHELLEIRAARLGAHHPDTLATMNNLATVLTEQGRYDESEPLLREVIAQRERWLGPDHPGTTTSRMNLVHVLLTQGRAAEAEPLVRANLASCESALGPDHPNTLKTRNHLAYMLEDLGRLAEAESLYRANVDAYLAAAGPEAVDTIIARNNLAMLLSRLERHDEAVTEFRAIEAAARAVLPAGHFHLGIFLNNCGAGYLDAGLVDDARPILEESLAILEAALPPEHERLVKARERLARARDAG